MGRNFYWQILPIWYFSLFESVVCNGSIVSCGFFVGCPEIFLSADVFIIIRWDVHKRIDWIGLQLRNIMSEDFNDSKGQTTWLIRQRRMPLALTRELGCKTSVHFPGCIFRSILWPPGFLITPFWKYSRLNSCKIHRHRISDPTDCHSTRLKSVDVLPDYLPCFMQQLFTSTKRKLQKRFIYFSRLGNPCQSSIRLSTSRVRPSRNTTRFRPILTPTSFLW